MRRMLRTALLLVMVAPGIAAAQDAVLSGTVTDSTGLLLPGVTVEVRSTADDQAHTAVTDGTGTFAITDLPAGSYAVTFSLSGFRTVVRDGVAVVVGATATLDVELPVQLEERVVVVGSRAQPRSVTESSVPIDAIPFQDVISQGATTLDYQLRTLIPSFNVATHPISDAATLVRPATLRNLAARPYAGAGERQAPPPLVGRRLVCRGDGRRAGAGHLDHPVNRPAAGGSAARRRVGAVRLGRHRRGVEFPA